MSENWLDEIFGPSTFEFDFSKYSPEVLTKTFKLNEPKIVTAIKYVLYFIGFILLVAAVTLLCLFALPESNNEKIGSDNLITENVVIEEPTPPVIEEPIAEGPVNTEENTDFYPSESYNPPFQIESPGFFEIVFDLVINNILPSAVDGVFQILENVGILITHPDSEEAIQIMENYREYLKGIVNDSPLLNEDTKSIIIEYINELNLDPVFIHETALEILNAAIDGVQAIEQAIRIIYEHTSSGEILTKEDIREILDLFFVN